MFWTCCRNYVCTRSISGCIPESPRAYYVATLAVIISSYHRSARATSCILFGLSPPDSLLPQARDTPSPPKFAFWMISPAFTSSAPSRPAPQTRTVIPEPNSCNAQVPLPRVRGWRALEFGQYAAAVCCNRLSLGSRSWLAAEECIANGHSASAAVCGRP